MKLTVKQIARGAIIAALYAVLCFFLQPFSYGSVQCRVSEALTVLPALLPEAIPGLFVGCFIANLLGGSSVALLDMILGSLTTLAAAFLTRMIYKKFNSFALSLLPPVVLNALIVGAYVPFIYTDGATAATVPVVLFSMLTVGIGQAIVCYILGLPLGKALSKTKLF
ncbi:MAG: QueT transporter family protein [Clostridia bacterium]|nr:QueT transporter family protein [Clostridia bacterium]